MAPLRRLAPVIGLFLLAPFVGEFLLGNITIEGLFIGVFLAPMYGGGAILVRELARRYGGGWPTMALLACAYALIEEGPLDQLLWKCPRPWWLPAVTGWHRDSAHLPGASGWA